MRLLIDTNGVQFRVAGPAKPKQDYKDKERQATTRDGEPIWTVRLDAIEPDREARETIWVEVAGEQPRLTFDGYAVVRGLVFAPWVGRDGKIRRAFRAESVEPSGPASPCRPRERPGQPGTIPYPRSDPGDPMTSIQPPRPGHAGHDAGRAAAAADRRR